MFAKLVFKGKSANIAGSGQIAAFGSVRSGSALFGIDVLYVFSKRKVKCYIQLNLS